MKTTELFVEQTLTGFLVLAAGAAPFLSWETLENLPGKAKGGIDISSAAGAIATPIAPAAEEMSMPPLAFPGRFSSVSQDRNGAAPAARTRKPVRVCSTKSSVVFTASPCSARATQRKHRAAVRGAARAPA